VFTWRRAVCVAVLIFLALFAFRFAFGPPEPTQDFGLLGGVSFESGRKNYATAAAGQAIGDSQKYEKVATLTELTGHYEDDRKRLDGLIATHQAIVQFERATGLTGRRTLHLGIGVPPERFDAFIDAAKGIGRNAQVDIIKNDKTNEYLQLRAKRTTLEKARAGLEALQASGGSIDERVNVQSRLTDIEERIQALAVSLGEFDSQNELCTVKLTLRETLTAAPRSVSRRVTEALEWAAIRYALLGAGFLTLVIGCWLAAGLVAVAQRLVGGAAQSG
jgi:uncharacterized protein DUF4349